MGIADDLPTLADRLANPAPGDPEQACLRRAISTPTTRCFISLSRKLCKAGAVRRRHCLGLERTLEHRNMRDVSGTIDQGSERVEHPADFRACRTKGCREDVLRLARVAPRGGLRQCQDLDRR